MNHTSPFLTVALPTYNRADLLLGAIESVITQTDADFELIIVDDASPDNTEQVVTELIAQVAQQANAPTITYLRQPVNLGTNAAYRRATESARGEFVVYLDDDDRFTPGYLAYIQSVMKVASPTVALAGPVQRVLQSTPTGDIVIKENNMGFTRTTQFAGKDFMRHPLAGMSGTVVRLSAARAVGGWREDFYNGGDLEFMLRLATQWDYMFLPEIVLIVYNHATRIQVTRNMFETGKCMERILELHPNMFTPFPQIHHNFYQAAAHKYYGGNAPQAGRRCMWQAIKLRPFAMWSWRRWLMLEIDNLFPGTFNRLYQDERHGALR